MDETIGDPYLDLLTKTLTAYLFDESGWWWVETLLVDGRRVHIPPEYALIHLKPFDRAKREPREGNHRAGGTNRRFGRLLASGASEHMSKRCGMRCGMRGFSIVELITVVGIIAVLLALLMPALSEARRNAQTVQCASNMRQLTTALIGYATEFRGKFPSNAAVYKVYWYNQDQVGRHVRSPIVMSDRSLGGGVFVCPGDVEGAVRSYAMNIWASGVVSPAVEAAQNTQPPKGKLFNLGVGDSSNMILLAEAYSSYDAPEETEPKVGHSCHAVIGFIGDKPGERFIGKGEPDLGNNRFGPTQSQVCWFRHRAKGDRYALITEARGRANFGFADGHVELLSHTDCADPLTGKSTFRAMWSPIDREID